MNKDFNLLDERSSRLLMIFICLLFSVLFVNIFVPFNINRWISDSGLVKFFRLSSYGFIVALVFLFTQFPLRRWAGISHFKIKTYILWLAIEISLISLVYIFLYGNPLGNFMNDFIFSLKYTTLGILIPYSFSLIFLYYRKQRLEIASLHARIGKTNLIKLVPFEDENRRVKLSVAPRDLLMLESTDNYLSVYFINEGKLHRTLIRNNLKRIEESIPPGMLLRCHRSHMINMMNIEYVERQGKKMMIKLRFLDDPVSVSKKYQSRLNEYLQRSHAWE